MIDPSITYFPVGNGDTSLITLSDGTRILIDCNISKGSKDDDQKDKYPVHEHLLKEIRKEKEVPHIDVFILTHPDEDHCRGFDECFYSGKPSNYSDSDEKQGKIIIDELWFTPRIFSPHEQDLSDPAKKFLEEAKRRMSLYKKDEKEANISGNRLRIIGYSSNEKLKGLEEIITTPGSITSSINNNTKNDFSFFIHAPFKKENDSKWAERNDTSIVLQARFDIGDEKNAGLAFFGGDSICGIFEEILAKSDESDLQWDILLAPHHCSWYFFNESSYDEDPNPSDKILEFLEMKREGAIVVASSKPIEDDDDNPPHFVAFKEFKKVVGEKKVLVTMEHPKIDNPQPIYYIITKMGPQKKDLLTDNSIVSSAAIDSVIRTPQTYGEQ